MATQYSEKQVVLLKQGSTPDVTNALKMCDNTPLSIELKKTECMSRGDGNFPSTEITFDEDGTVAKISPTVSLRTPSALGVAPATAELFKVCGLDEEIVTDESVTYFPVLDATTIQKGELINYIDGEKRVVTGVMGNLKFSFSTGEPIKIDADLSGYTSIEPTNEANPTGITLDSNSILIVSSMSATTLSGDTINIESMELNLGADVKDEYLTQLKGFDIVNPQPKITITDKKSKGDFSHWTDLKSHTVKSILIEIIASNSQKMQIKADNLKYNDLNEEDKDGKMYIKRVFDLHPNASGRKFEIIYK